MNRFARPSSVLAFTFALGASAALVSLTEHDANAQTATPTVNCVDPSRPNLVYAAGSTALRPFLSVLAPLLAADSPAYTIVYQSQGSCTGVQAIYDADPTKRTIRDIVGNYAVFFKPDGTSQECWLDVNGQGAAGTTFPQVDIGLSDVFAQSCGATAPSGVTIQDYFGPIQPMTFVVPAASAQTSISAEAAYLAFGLGGGSGKAAPWIDGSLFFVRNASSGTQPMIARAIGVPAEKWWGVNRGGSTQVRQGLKVILDKPTAEKSIGILSTDVADEERNNLRILAFKATGQTCGYLPDSTSTKKDKLNVRDGHYPIWGPVHLFARTSGGLPSPAAGALVGRFVTARVDKAVLDAEISRSLVPQCAMRVSRSEEMGPLSSKQPDFECGCYFDFKTNGTTDCKACGGPGDCPSNRSACNFGYCEAR